jgi:hypothetical protein
MLISYKHRFIFVHIYKNAGSSIRSALMPYAFNNGTHALVYRIARRLGVSLPFSWNPVPMHGHSTAQSIAERIGLQKFQSFFSFAIVRNPWDWQVSLFSYPRKSKTHHQHDMFSSFKDFDEYIRWRCAEEVRFQKDFIRDQDGKRLVSFIGRYENLEQDFRAICERIGVKVQLPRLNVSKSKPYQSYYTPETIGLVRRTFAPDIELFGYEFE